MAITKSAKRALRGSARKRVFNLRRTRTMRVVIKEVRGLAEAGKLDEAQRRIPEAYKAIDKAAKRGVIKENNAARKKSRLVKFLKTKA